LGRFSLYEDELRINPVFWAYQSEKMVKKTCRNSKTPPI
jgi:hypothetical protein